MGILNFLKSKFNPEVSKEFDSLKNHHREALNHWLYGGYQPRCIIPQNKCAPFDDYDHEYDSIKKQINNSQFTIDIDNMNYEQKKFIVSRKRQILILYGTFHKYELILDREKSLDKINNSVSGWNKLHGIPYYFFYYFYPKHFNNIPQNSRTIRDMILNFKDGRCQAGLALEMIFLLSRTFYPEVSKLCFVCIPASTESSNSLRYGRFSNAVCTETGMENGFPHVHIIKEKKPSHLGGVDSAEYSLDNDFFEGQLVVLFDDVVTRGSTMLQFKELIEQSGATVICAISLGRTYSDYLGEVTDPEEPNTLNQYIGYHHPMRWKMTNEYNLHW